MEKSFPRPCSLYVHVPFCEKKCSFCSFAVAVSQMSRRDEYISLLKQEAQRYRGLLLSSIYIGGGTPSCLEPESIRVLGEQVLPAFRYAPGCEMTFEMNPESTDEGRLSAILDLGVNRVSLGVQTLNDERLRFLGRPHSVEGALSAFMLLRSFGFRNVNVDLMYGFPGQDMDELARDIDRILELGSEHVSIYSLTVEERSLFFARKIAVDDDAQGQAYELIRGQLEGAGLRQYEVSNFARRGYESVHNLNYWQGGDYIGVGMAAHSHLEGRRFWNVDTLPMYMKMMAEQGSAVVGEERLDSAAKLTEVFLFGLRMTEGVDLGALERKMGVDLSLEKKEALESFIDMGLLAEEADHIRATDRGRLVLDEISARLV